MMTSPNAAHDASHDHHHDHSSEGAGTMVIDPVCGMSVDPATAKHHFGYAGRDYFFCSGNCREKFEADPESYLKAAVPQPEPAPVTHDHVLWTCPMHPQIVRDGPAIARSAAWRWSRPVSRSMGPITN